VEIHLHSPSTSSCDNFAPTFIFFDSESAYHKASPFRGQPTEKNEDICPCLDRHSNPWPKYASWPCGSLGPTWDQTKRYLHKYIDSYGLCIRCESCVRKQSVYRTYEDVSRSFRTGRLERELQMVQLSATRCSCIAILCVSLVSFAAITLCVASQRVFIVVSVYFVIDSVRKLLDTPSCFSSLTPCMGRRTYCH
jgi:hypothetical protein